MRNNFNEKINKTAHTNEETAIVEATKEGVLDFVVPIELVDLPSKGKFYPDGHPLKNKETIEIKQMTAKEEDILTNKSYIKKGIVIDKLLESLLVDKTINVSSLLIGDRNAIMVAARIAAYGAYYDVTVSCTECGVRNLLNINLLEVTTKDIQQIFEKNKNKQNIEYERLESGNIIISLPKTGWKVECKLLNGTDERFILQLLESKRKDDPNAEITITDQLNFIIYSINGVSGIELVESAINIMPAGDAKLLRKLYQQLIPNVLIEKKYSCSSCKEEQELEVPFTQEFFWPK